MNKHTAFIITAIGAASLLPTVGHADVCGDGLILPADTWAMFSAPCIPPAGSESVNAQFNGDLGASAAYDSTWIMYKYVSATDQYVQLQDTDHLEQGVGYWIYSTKAGTLKIDDGIHTTSGPVYKGDCNIYGWPDQPCYKIDLAVPATTGATKWNLVGYPFLRDTDWADVHVAISTNSGANWTDAGVPLTADTTGYISKNGFVYTGSSYNTFDDTTSQESERQLKPNKSYWFQSKYMTGTTNIALLIPAPKYKVFVTNETWTGDLGGLSGADGKCQAAANNNDDLKGTYKAWLSSSLGSAADHLDHAGPYYVISTISGATRIADSWIDLIGGISEKIDQDENGNPMPLDSLLWTATAPNGQGMTTFGDCAEWESADALLFGLVGNTSGVGAGWTAFGTSTCNIQRSIICFSND